tara:strand:+ start:16214 stop:18247 length:2034 start_codon:yes stop_codon:yes gene_type:complete
MEFCEKRKHGAESEIAFKDHANGLSLGFINQQSFVFDPVSKWYNASNPDALLLGSRDFVADALTGNPVEKRTFAGNYRNSMVRTDAVIRTRRLTSEEVIRVNRVLKARAKRYIAAGKEEWLYPETYTSESWADIRDTFLPPKDDLWHFGGEIYARFESGEVHYQDAFGRTEKEREFLKKKLSTKTLRARDICGCGSGRKFGACCERKRVVLRPTWEERSIRERNLMLFTGISNILGLTEDRDWITVRRDITDEKIRDVYGLYDALWPRETNLLALLPKPDGEARAIYTGVLHPSVISNCALGLPLYFDELLIEHPFVHPRVVNKEFSPLEHPKKYRQEFLKSVILFLAIMPLVEQGLVTLFPDPCNFDFHLRDQMLAMAQFRSQGLKVDTEEETRFRELAREDHTLEQPENCRRVEAIAAEDPVEAELPEIAQLGNRRLVALRRRRVIKSSIVRLGQRRLDQHIDLGDLEADVFIADIEVDQGLKLAGEFVIVPLAQLADPVVKDPEGAEFSLIEMRHTNTGQDLQTEFFGHQIARIARDNAVIGINDERDNEADIAEALLEQAKLLLRIPPCLPVGRQEVAQRDKVDLFRHPRHREAIIAQPRAFIGTVVPIVLLNITEISVFFSLIHNNTATLAVDWSPLGTKRQRLKPLPSRSITATKSLTALSTLRGGEDTSK